MRLEVICAECQMPERPAYTPLGSGWLCDPCAREADIDLRGLAAIADRLGLQLDGLHAALEEEL